MRMTNVALQLYAGSQHGAFCSAEQVAMMGTQPSPFCFSSPAGLQC